ncbi:Gfo/Idh/MocA family oxidoreductase [Streptomyces mirabilis]|uniref:Gfo/Idh/MocA family protein n=1 Tax=Streptomyces mirabilis TaxID=68239 RepID=UPI00369E3BCE
MRIGIMGLGRIGSFHAETLAGLDGVDSLVVTDPVAAAVATATERFGATATDSPEALLAAGVDGVVIAAATDAHPDLILAAVRAGIPVFCEKPVARGVEESQEVLRAVEGSGVEVHIGYNRRFDAGFAAARRAVLSGELGDLHTVRSTTLDPAPPPLAYVAVSGGIFRDCGVHDFDIVRWVTGREVVEVYATGGNRGAEYIREAGDVDTASALLTLDDGTIAVISDSRHNARGHDVRLELHGMKDSIAVGLEDRLPLHLDDRVVVRTAAGERTEELGRRSSYTYQLEAFAAHLRRGTPLTLDAADALTTMRLIDDCYRAAGFPVRPRAVLPATA